MPTLLSKTQISCLEAMAANDGMLRREPGGFWVSGSPERDPEGHPLACSGTTTMKSLERLGLIERANVHFPDWKDTRRLTAAGKLAVAEIKKQQETTR